MGCDEGKLYAIGEAVPQTEEEVDTTPGLPIWIWAAIGVGVVVMGGINDRAQCGEKIPMIWWAVLDLNQ